ncbi:MAG TPA: PQQ-dependent sugar dehydrogenase [Usitatibacter sp.]|nr:PQQ-dependent sugar dehydrogenase [Usitatibacter sp.]
MRAHTFPVVILSLAILGGCYGMRPSSGGGQVTAISQAPRVAQASDVGVPQGYRVEVVATGLNFPTGVAFDDAGRPHIVESGYSYGEVFTTPRLLRIEPNDAKTVIASGRGNGPWNGVAFAQGAFFVAEGGQLEGGRILRIAPNGETRAIVEGLPSLGDHHTNGPAVGPDGAIYFGQGTATNSGVVGEDNAQFGWLKRKPDFHDIPCRDIRLAGRMFESANPLGGGRVTTGAFAPFGKNAGSVVRGRLPCNGAIMKVSPNGGDLQLVAWGFRNPFGLAFDGSGRLFVTDNGYDERGSRPVWGTADHLWAVQPGTWYGWPDFSGERGLSDSHFQPPGKDVPGFVMAEHPNKPPRPAAYFGVHSSSNGLDFSRNPGFGHVGEAFVAQFGDMAPNAGKVLAPVGFKVVRVNTASGRIEDFMVNRGRDNGPASRVGGQGLERPVAVRFAPRGDALYVVDFGVMTMGPKGPEPRQGTGVLWRVTRGGA